MEKEKKETPYQYREDNSRSADTGNISQQTNSADMNEISDAEPDVEKANDSGLGDAGENDSRFSTYTQNRSADA